MKRKIRIIILGLMCFILLFGCGKKADPQNAKISSMSASYAFDVNSFPELSANADYVLVGKVLDELDTTYNTPRIYTHYSVEVVENLKGELRQDKPIEVKKFGGVTKDGSECFLFGGDILPVEGGTYIFFIYDQEDGSNLASGPNSTLPLDDNSAKTKLTTRSSSEFDFLSYEEKIQEIKDSIEMNVPAVMKPSISNDDVSKK